jgi:hypothetical protein
VTPEQVAFLRSGAADAALSGLAPADVEGDAILGTLTRLRRRLTPDQAAAVVETVSLRGRAAAKFSLADSMLFTSDGLEQATHEVVARHRARRFGELGAATFVDLGCGIGGDAIALAGVGPVAAVDLDPVRLRIAAHNAAVHGLGGGVHPVLADVERLAPLHVEGGFADPSRREGGSRVFDPDRYSPPLGPLVDRWAGALPLFAIKVAPGIRRDALPDGAALEVVSLAGAVKEAVLWFGAGDAGSRRATLLPKGDVLRSARGAEVPVSDVGAYLLEPDGAVIRAGLVEEAARLVGARKVDRDIAYLTSDDPVESPFLTGYRVESVMPFNLKHLRAHLRTLQVGRVVIKKRGSPITPEELRPRLDLRGNASRIVFLTKVGGEATVVIAEDQSPRA